MITDDELAILILQKLRIAHEKYDAPADLVKEVERIAVLAANLKERLARQPKS